MTAVESALVRKLNRFAPLGRDELAALARLEAHSRPVPAQTELAHERQASLQRVSGVVRWASGRWPVGSAGGRA
jgi:hypothetical protein